MTAFVLGMLAAIAVTRALGAPPPGRKAAAPARAGLAPAVLVTIAALVACAEGYAAVILAGAIVTAAGTAALVWLLHRILVAAPAPAGRPVHARWS